MLPFPSISSSSSSSPCAARAHLPRALPGQPRPLQGLLPVVGRLADHARFSARAGTEGSRHGSCDASARVECVVLAGPSGVGKSTVACRIAQLLNAEPTTIRWSEPPPHDTPYFLRIAAQDQSRNPGCTVMRAVRAFFEQSKANLARRPLPDGRRPVIVLCVDEITENVRLLQSFHDLLAEKRFTVRVGERHRARDETVCIPAGWGLLFVAATNVGEKHLQRAPEDDKEYGNHLHQVQADLQSSLYVNDHHGSMLRRFQPNQLDSLVLFYSVSDVAARLALCRQAMLTCIAAARKDRHVELSMPCTVDHALRRWDCTGTTMFDLLSTRITNALPSKPLHGFRLHLAVKGESIVVVKETALPPPALVRLQSALALPSRARAHTCTL